MSGQISDCLERAADAERRAAATTDPGLRRDYEHIARTWRQLAASYQFSETLERFLLDRDRSKKTLM